MEAHSSALCMYDRGRVLRLAICPADLEALHLGTRSGDGGTTLLVQRTLRDAAALRAQRYYGGHAFRLVMARGVLWLPVDRRRRPVEVCRYVAPVGGGAISPERMMHLPQPPSVAPVRPTAPMVDVAKTVAKAAPKPPPPSPQQGPQCALW